MKKQAHSPIFYYNFFRSNNHKPYHIKTKRPPRFITTLRPAVSRMIYYHRVYASLFDFTEQLDKIRTMSEASSHHEMPP